MRNLFLAIAGALFFGASCDCGYARASDHSNEVIYWEPSTREFYGCLINESKTRKAPEFKKPPFKDVSERVVLSSDEDALRLETKINGKWQYRLLNLTPGMLE